MWTETAVVFDVYDCPILWHAPHDRTSVALPDSAALWEFIWEHRKTIAGIAHTHPGEGPTGPSLTDLTTFAAIENGLGKRLDWYIATSDYLCWLEWVGPKKLDYVKEEVLPWRLPVWVRHLRYLSEKGIQNGK